MLLRESLGKFFQANTFGIFLGGIWNVENIVYFCKRSRILRKKVLGNTA